MNSFVAPKNVYDIAIVGDIMIGFDYDTEQIIKHRFAFADQVDPDILWTGYLTPPPGSPHWADAVKLGQLTSTCHQNPG